MQELKQEEGFFSDCAVLLSSCKLKNFDYQEEKQEIPSSLNLNCGISIDLKPFLEFVKFCRRVDNEKIAFEMDDNNLRLSINDLNYRLIGKGEGISKKTSFSVEYLYRILTSFSAKELKEFEKIDFFFNSNGDYPIRINLRTNWFVLAPRVEY